MRAITVIFSVVSALALIAATMIASAYIASRIILGEWPPQQLVLVVVVAQIIADLLKGLVSDFLKLLTDNIKK